MVTAPVSKSMVQKPYDLVILFNASDRRHFGVGSGLHVKHLEDIAHRRPERVFGSKLKSMIRSISASSPPSRLI